MDRQRTTELKCVALLQGAANGAVSSCAITHARASGTALTRWGRFEVVSYRDTLVRLGTTRVELGPGSERFEPGLPALRQELGADAVFVFWTLRCGPARGDAYKVKLFSTVDSALLGLYDVERRGGGDVVGFPYDSRKNAVSMATELVEALARRLDEPEREGNR